MDEPPYKEIDGDQLSSMLLNPNKIIIGYRGKRIPILSPNDDFYFWADAYDEEANIMEEVAVFWQVTPPEAARPCVGMWPSVGSGILEFRNMMRRSALTITASKARILWAGRIWRKARMQSGQTSSFG